MGSCGETEMTMQDEELIERIDKMLLASPVDEYTTMIAVEPDDLREIRDRLEALAQPVVGVERLRRATTLNAQTASDAEWTELLAAALDVVDLAASPSSVVGDEGRRTALCYLIERMCPDKPDSNLGNPVGSQVEALADAILSSTPVMSVSGEADVKSRFPIFSYLLGELDFNGNWFGDEPTGPRFWWRKNLREALAALSTPVTEVPDPHSLDRAGMMQEVD